MATIGQDTFTEASNVAIGSHTPDVGAGWTEENSTINVIASTDEASSSGSSTWYCRKGDDIGADQMDVSVDCKVSGSTNRRAGAVARMGASNFDGFSAEIFWTSGANADVALFKRVSGTRTQIGSTVSTGVATSTYMTVQLKVRAGSQEVLINGVSKITASEPDSTLSGNQRAGFVLNGNGTGARIDNFLSESVAVAQTISGAGAVASAEAQGSGSLNQQVQGNGMGGGETIGTLGVLQQLIIQGIAPGEQLGSSALLLTVIPQALASSEQPGTLGLTLSINSAGLGSAETFGAVLVQIEGGGLAIVAQGITSAETLGTLGIAQQIIAQPGGSSEQLGTALLHQSLLPQGISSGEAIATALMVALQVIAQGIGSGELSGTPWITIPLQIVPQGIGSVESIGGTVVVPSGIFINGVELVWRVEQRGLAWTLTTRPAAWTFN